MWHLSGYLSYSQWAMSIWIVCMGVSRSLVWISIHFHLSSSAKTDNNGGVLGVNGRECVFWQKKNAFLLNLLLSLLFSIYILFNVLLDFCCFIRFHTFSATTTYREFVVAIVFVFNRHCRHSFYCTHTRTLERNRNREKQKQFLCFFLRTAISVHLCTYESQHVVLKYTLQRIEY